MDKVTEALRGLRPPSAADKAYFVWSPSYVLDGVAGPFWALEEAYREAKELATYYEEAVEIYEANPARTVSPLTNE